MSFFSFNHLLLVHCRFRTHFKNDCAICKIDNQWEFAVWLRKLKQGLYINLEGWDRERNGREVQKGGDIYLWMIHVEV